MIICRDCGSKIWDYAQICPHCGEVLKNEDNNPIETTTLNSNSAPDFKFYIGGGGETVFAHQKMYKKFYLIIKKLSPFPISGAKVQLSGPPHIDLIVKSRKINKKKMKNVIYFIISANNLGDFTLTATLTSDAGHRIALPIKIRVKPINYVFDESPWNKVEKKDIDPIAIYNMVLGIIVGVPLIMVSLIFIIIYADKDFILIIMGMMITLIILVILLILSVKYTNSE